MKIFKKLFSTLFLALLLLMPGNSAKSGTTIDSNNGSAAIIDNTTEVLFAAPTRISRQSAVKVKSI